MTQEEIQKYNEKCALFIGLEKTNINGVWGTIKHLTENPNSGLTCMVPVTDSLQFHSDWNWIMEVVEAIEKLGFDTDSYSPFETCKEGFYEFNIWGKETREIEGRGSTRKEAYIHAINQFLIWYNDTKN